MIPNHSRAQSTRRRAATALGVLASVLASLACERAASSVPHETSATALDSASGPDSALAYPFVPNPTVTPGDVLPVTTADVCTPGYSRRVRNVPINVKRRAYALYDIRTHEPGEFEVDHLISLSLGGSNSIRNLWPESFRTSPWNAYVKDALEVELHRRVCAGTIDLAKAQFVISHNWVVGYRTYVQGTPPSATPRKKQRSHRTQSQPQFQGAVP